MSFTNASLIQSSTRQPEFRQKLNWLQSVHIEINFNLLLQFIFQILPYRYYKPSSVHAADMQIHIVYRHSLNYMSRNMQISNCSYAKGVDVKRVSPWTLWELFWGLSLSIAVGVLSFPWGTLLFLQRQVQLLD